MKTSSFKQAIEAQFDCLSKKVIKRAVKKGYRDMKRREKHECLFSDIPDYEQSRFGELDKYESDYTVFNILGIEVWVEDDQLSEALKTLTEKKRNIILLSYFMDMSDSEISEFIKIPRSNVQYLYWSSFLVTLCSEIMLYIETPLVSYSYSLNEVSHSCTS